MCSGAIVLYGIPRVIAGENRSFLLGVTVEVVQDEQCIAMMKQFIEAHPELWNEDIGE